MRHTRTGITTTTIITITTTTIRMHTGPKTPKLVSGSGLFSHRLIR